MLSILKESGTSSDSAICSILGEILQSVVTNTSMVAMFG